MFKTSLAVTALSLLVAGCAPDLVEERPAFPQGVWTVNVENDLRNDEIYTDGGLAIVSNRTVTIYRNNVVEGCHDKWSGDVTDDTYTELVNGNAVTIFGEEYDDDIALHVTTVGETEPFLYVEASYLNSTTTLQDFAEQNIICD